MAYQSPTAYKNTDPSENIHFTNIKTGRNPIQFRRYKPQPGLYFFSGKCRNVQCSDPIASYRGMLFIRPTIQVRTIDRHECLVASPR